MAQGDVPASPGRGRRRRREKRQLEQLAAEARREPSPIAARAHFSVIEEKGPVEDRALGAPPPETPDEPLKEGKPGGFHVKAIPIDEPFRQVLPEGSESQDREPG